MLLRLSPEIPREGARGELLCLPAARPAASQAREAVKRWMGCARAGPSSAGRLSCVRERGDFVLFYNSGGKENGSNDSR